MCESGGGRPGLPVPNSPYGVCGRKPTLEEVVEQRLNQEGISRTESKTKADPEK